MAYFSNGTEGMIYQERYCVRCIHGQDLAGKGCAVWDAHFFFNGEKDKSDVLDFIIPRVSQGAGNDECKMFVETK